MNGLFAPTSSGIQSVEANFRPCNEYGLRVAEFWMLSLGIFWCGLILNLRGSEVQVLQTNSYGVRPLRVCPRTSRGIA
jgi:hypothetical protein